MSDDIQRINERPKGPTGPQPGTAGAAWHGTPEGEVRERTPLPPGPSRQERLAAMQAAENPLLEAAQPLLRALADMPTALAPEEVDTLHRLLLQEISTFQQLCEQAPIQHKHAVAASYALCTALDEAASGTAWGGGKGGNIGVWAGKLLAREFHEDTHGGDKVFLLIGRLASSPQEHIDLLEVMFMILSLGFEGRYRGLPDGRRQHEAIRQRLFTLVDEARGPVPHELSPQWRGIDTGPLRLRHGIPVWVTVVVLSLILLVMYAWYSYRLERRITQVQQNIAAIGMIKPPPAPPAKLLRLKELLSAEIARGTVTVEEDARRSAVSFRGDDMFVPGQARLSPRLVPVLAKVAEEINQVTGTVHITGHSDNQPIRTREFPDNQVLSEKRAAAVAVVLQDKGVVASRMRVEGRGDSAPVADNASPAGRARNRRVDIVVTQSSAGRLLQ